LPRSPRLVCRPAEITACCRSSQKPGRSARAGHVWQSLCPAIYSMHLQKRDGFVGFQIEMVVCRMMQFSLTSVSISTRRKFTSILLAVLFFALLAGRASRASGRPPMFATLNAIFVGLGVEFFEEFYVQSLRGRRIRNLHPLAAILIYTTIVVVIFFIG